MVNQEKKSDGDISSGSRFPLLDQALCGFSGGTFSVMVSDNYNNDIIRFQKEFPVLVGQDIAKRIMMPWKKDEALKANR